MPLQQTSGNDTTDAYGGGAAAALPNYIEDVFSTYLYAGNDTTNNINNGVDLSTYGGLVWMKSRSSATSNFLCDTARGRQYYLYSNATLAQQGPSAAGKDLATFNTNGFTLGQGAYTDTNYTGTNYVSWTFRKQPKFFDVVTFTTNGSGGASFTHNLGSIPGCLIVKSTGGTDAWYVWHRGLTGGINDNVVQLNTTGAQFSLGTTTTVTSTNVTIGTGSLGIGGAPYVAYLFAHNAGGFGAAGTDNVITCGGFTTDANGYASINLGYEPAWVMYKVIDTTGNWGMGDVMRGMPANTLTAGAGGDTQRLFANTSAAESTETNYVCNVTSTGFAFHSGGYPSNTFIYIAIRRGPMKTPTDATKVFLPELGTGGTPGYPASFTVDALLNVYLAGNPDNPNLASRLTGANYIATSSNAAEINGSPYWKWDFQTGVGTSVFTSAFSGQLLQRAPGFFDVVCYTGTGTTLNVNHNLAVVPELIIIKKRSASGDWFTGFSFGASTYSYAKINLSDAAASGGYGFAFGAQPTTTQFTPGSSAGVNGSGATYVAYLFATCAGVSKVGSYTGNGTTQTINCGFTGGARFVLIKRTDSTGDWYVYDTARGMTTLTDPYYLINTTAAQVATLGSVTTVSTGFALNAALANININSASYIFLAIA